MSFAMVGFFFDFFFFFLRVGVGYRSTEQKTSVLLNFLKIWTKSCVMAKKLQKSQQTKSGPSPPHTKSVKWYTPFYLAKTETGAKSAPRAKKLVTKAGGRHKLVHRQDLHVTSGVGMVCHMLIDFMIAI